MDKMAFYTDMIQLVEKTPPTKLPNKIVYLKYMNQQLKYVYRYEPYRKNMKSITNKVTITGPVTLDIDQ
jgi:hypothetical protein